MKNFLYFLFLFVFVSNIHSQSLVGVNVDDLTDSQILSIMEKAEAKGLNINTGEQMAISMGLSVSEARKFKERLIKLNNSMPDDEGLTDFQFLKLKPEIESKDEILDSQVKVDSSNIFGHDYFGGTLESFDRTFGARAPGNYVMGPNDELTISVFGSSYFQETYKVNDDGILSFGSKLGKLNITGLSFSDVEKLVRAKFSKSFSLLKNSFRVSLSYSRKISVSIVGEVNKPGTYNFSAMNNVFHGILLSGGPTEFGSLRDIKIYRNGELIESVDLYNFFMRPEDSSLPFLQDGDFLLIPDIKNLVSTSGGFKKEMYFEMLPDENISDLLEFSSGFHRHADTSKIKVYRQENGEKVIIDAKSEKFSSIKLNNGDSLVVDLKNGKLDRFIEISGALAQPGKYGFSPGMTVGNLINLAGGIIGMYPDKELILSRLKENGYYAIQRYSLLNNEILDINLVPRDAIHIAFKTLNPKEKYVSVYGAVNLPGQITFAEGMTLNDALKISGGLLMSSDHSRIEITSSVLTEKDGVLTIKKQKHIVSVDPRAKENWSKDEKKSDFLLKPFDQISVRKIKDFGSVEKVFIDGEVNFPGYYAIIDLDENLASLISRSGGLKENADLYNSRIFRDSIPNIVLNLEKALNSKSSEFNYSLIENDSIFIPKKTQLIQISGDGHSYFDYTTDSSLHGPYIQKLKANGYINKYALGFNKKSDKKQLYVAYPSGRTVRTKQFLFWNRYPSVRPGATIFINKKLKKRKKNIDPKPVDWNQIIASLTSAAMGFGTVYALINRP